MPLSAHPWQESFSIRSYEVEPSGRVSPQTLCNYLQEAAANHANALGFSVEHLISQNLTWVLSRLSVHFASYPSWRDDVTVTTWPSGEKGLSALRDYQIHQQGNLIASGTSAWMLIDITRRRPTRIPESIRKMLPQATDRALVDDLKKLNSIDTVLHERTFNVRYSDLDLNQHVNNVRYIDWAIESIPRELHHGLQLQHVKIHFKAETSVNEQVLAQITSDKRGSDIHFHHILYRTSDGREVARVFTHWTPKQTPSFLS